MENVNKKRDNLTAPNPGEEKTGSRETLDSLFEKAFSNHLILKHILTFTDNEDLLELSRVNKLWCSTARSILRHDRRCLAYVTGAATFERAACKTLLKFNHTLMNCHEIPYSGIAFHASGHSDACVGKMKSAYVEDTDIMESFTPSDDSDLEEWSEEDTESSEEENEGSEEENESMDGDSEDYISDAEFLSPGEATKIRTFYNETSHEYPRHAYLNSHLSQIFDAILEGMPHRYLEIYWSAKTNCPAQALFVKILQEKGQNLFGLKITRFPHSIESNLKQYLKIDKENWLQNLVVLDWAKDNSCLGKVIPAKVKGELVDAAPNLQKITGIIYLEDLKILIEKNKSHLIESLGFCCDKNSFTDEPLTQWSLVKYAESKPKIKFLWFVGTLSDRNKFNENIIGVTEHLLRNLLEPVSASVEEIHLDQSQLMLRLRNCLVQPLEKLKKLYLRIHEKFDKRVGFATLERLDWGICFPALKIIEISMSLKENDNLKIDDLQQLTSTFVCPTVTDIILVQKLVAGIDGAYYWNVYDNMDFISLAYLSRLFPNVTNFTLIRAATLNKLLNFLWISWPNLETITLRHVKINSVAHNLDAAFCGISKTECLSIFLRKLNLDVLQIVPTSPSILSMKRLKKFRIEFLDHTECERKKKTSLKFLSQISVALALKRMPELMVEVARQECNAWRYPCEFSFEHLRPFLKLIDEGEGRC